MKRIYRHYGIIKNGKKQYSNPALQQESIAELEGQEFEEVITKRMKVASRDQHGYYRGGIIPEALAHECFGGYTEDELHEVLANKFLSYYYTKMVPSVKYGTLPTVITKTQSLSGISKEDMTVFIEKVIRFLAEQGIVVKTPEEYYYGKFRAVTTENKS